MTIAEALSIPKGMDFEEYEKILQEKRKLEKYIRNLSDKIQGEELSLEVLSDEAGSERHNKHLQNKQKAETRRKSALKKLMAIEERLKAK